MKAWLMDRRGFIKLLGASALAGSALSILSAKAADIVRRVYPGPVKPLDYAEIAKPGPWAG